MTPGARLGIALAASVATAATGVWIAARVRRWRRKSPEEIERLRRLGIHRGGRIAAGHVVDLIESDHGDISPRLIVYQYEVAGVTYEVAQDVSMLPHVFDAAHGCGTQTASIKYDPRQPTNSIIACEEWNGIRGNGPVRD